MIMLLKTKIKFWFVTWLLEYRDMCVQFTGIFISGGLPVRSPNTYLLFVSGPMSF